MSDEVRGMGWFRVRGGEGDRPLVLDGRTIFTAGEVMDIIQMAPSRFSRKDQDRPMKVVALIGDDVGVCEVPPPPEARRLFDALVSPR